MRGIFGIRPEDHLSPRLMVDVLSSKMRWVFQIGKTVNIYLHESHVRQNANTVA
jgi:hypothetical protein